MTHLFEQQDYRVWLAERIQMEKSSKPNFSNRFVAIRLDVNAAHLTRVLQCSKHLSLAHIPQLSKLFALNAAEESYLEALMRFNRARSARDCQKYFLEMQAIRGVQYRTIDDVRHEYFSRWEHVAMRTLLSLLEFRGKRYDRLGALFSIPLDAQQAEDSVALLEKLGMIERDSNGIYRALDRVLSSGDGWMSEAVAAFQKETIHLAGELIDVVPRQERDVSTLTIPMSTRHLDGLRLQIREFRQQVIQWAQTLDHEDSVYQMNLQLFPIARVPHARQEGT